LGGCEGQGEKVRVEVGSINPIISIPLASHVLETLSEPDETHEYSSMSTGEFSKAARSPASTSIGTSRTGTAVVLRRVSTSRER